MTLQTNRNYLGFALETDGAVATVPTHLIPLLSGAIPYVEVSHEETRETVKQAADVDVSEIKNNVAGTFHAYEELMAPLLEWAIGSRSKAGSADPYTHTIIKGSVPKATIWTYIDNGAGGYTVTRTDHVVCSGLTLNAEGKGAVKVEIKGEGTETTYVEAPVATAAINLTEAGHKKYITVGGTAKYSGASQAPELVQFLSTVSVELSHDLDTTPQFGSAKPYSIDAKSLNVKPSIEMQGTQDEFRTIINGSTSATTASNVPVYGSTEITLLGQETGHSLVLTIGAVVWKPSAVEADPENGRYNMKVEADTNGASITAVAINGYAG